MLTNKLLLAAIFLVCLKFSPVNGQASSDCEDKEWCTIPAFSTYCTNPQYRVLMLENCPRFCGVCSDPADADDARCSTNNGGCEHRCTIDDDQVQCECYPGYELTANLRNCTDINECAQGGRCTDFTRPFCVNRLAGYDCSNQSCSQNPGYFNRYQSDECCRDIEDLSCGRDTSVERIVGGTKATLGGWPWMVYVLINNRVLCGGTLVHPSWVVTAAHCFRDVSLNSTVETFFGRINPYEHEPHVQERVVTQIILHENWDKTRFPYNDIALMRLSSPVSINVNVDLACLPNGEKPTPGTRCYVTGFGTTSFRGSAADALLEVDLLVVDSETCKRTYEDGNYPIDEDIMFCAGRVEGGKDSCQGDSGGPLVCQRCSSCQWYLAGVVSFGRGCARPNFFGVYTDVEYYEEWISGHTGIPVNKDKMCNNNNNGLPQRWARWGSWSSCSESCDIGTRTRSRTCIDGIIGSPGCLGNGRESAICNTQDCPVWSEYGSWSDCSVSCEEGTHNRERSCMNGEVGDDGCHEGSATETMTCNEQNCPVWRNWGSWSSCSASCAGGTRTSERSCNTFGVEGAMCDGDSSRSEDCQQQPCPRWETWATWSTCSLSCSTGTRSRARSCVYGNIGHIGCPEGSELEEEDCNTQLCGSWSNWGSWSACSVSCRRGIQSSTRECIGGSPGEGGCPGEFEISRFCQTGPCPVWNNWGVYTPCSHSCGEGSRMRRRSCQNGDVGEVGCQGEIEEILACNTRNCPVWRNWGSWSSCTVSCAGGTRTSERSCNNFGLEDAMCDGDSSRSEDCQQQPCPRWDDWTLWTTCSASCSTGSRSRTRECLHGSVGEIGCSDGSDNDDEDCNTHLCGTWSHWESWSSCSVTCGQGTQMQTRQCSGGIAGQGGCMGTSEESRACDAGLCPVWNDWSSYGSCSLTCGRGSRTRTRTCENGEPGDVGCQGDTAQDLVCNSQQCPEWNSWETWTDCSDTCGGGIRSANRECLYGVIGDIGCDGSDSRIGDCNTQSCPHWSEYSDWGPCTVTCGGGSQTSSRSCIDGDVGQVGCVGSEERLQICNTETCPVWGDWVRDGECSRTCDRGQVAERRECFYGSVGQEGCIGPITRTVDCLVRVCPSFWSEWSDYSACTVTCGSGSQTRTRICEGGDNPSCPGDSSEMRTCGEPCRTRWADWNEWGTCSKTCSGGFATRNRGCLDGSIGEPGCSPLADATDTQVCNVLDCPECMDIVTGCQFLCSIYFDYVRVNCRKTCNYCAPHQPWNQWMDCSVSCGGGFRRRTRSCLNSQTCDGSSEQVQACNTDMDCSGYTQWSAWSVCTVSCDGGMRERTRTCPPETECLPDEHGNLLLQSASCQTDPCPGAWKNWGDYSECTVTCGGGSRSRSRVCLGGEVGGPGCEGEDVEESSCATEVCPGSWTNWNAVGICSALCGPGMQVQTRRCEGGEPGGPGCDGGAQRTVECNQGDCITQWLSWGTWGSCSSSCEAGRRRKTRTCENGNPGDEGCEGAAEQSEDCNTGSLPAACTATTPAPTQTGSCIAATDLIQNCRSIIASCTIPEHFDFMNTNCRRTCCDAASESRPSSTCVDLPLNAFYTCAQICNLPNFRQIVQTFCRATCNLCNIPNAQGK